MPRKSSKTIKTLTANRIVLQSPKGKVKAIFDASDETEYVSINLLGANKQTALCLCVNLDGNPVIYLDGKNGKTRLALGASEKSSGLLLSDSEGRVVCEISVLDGIPRIILPKVKSQKSAK